LRDRSTASAIDCVFLYTTQKARRLPFCVYSNSSLKSDQRKIRNPAHRCGPITEFPPQTPSIMHCPWPSSGLSHKDIGILNSRENQRAILIPANIRGRILDIRRDHSNFARSSPVPAMPTLCESQVLERLITASTRACESTSAMPGKRKYPRLFYQTSSAVLFPFFFWGLGQKSSRHPTPLGMTRNWNA